LMRPASHAAKPNTLRRTIVGCAPVQGCGQPQQPIDSVRHFRAAQKYPFEAPRIRDYGGCDVDVVRRSRISATPVLPSLRVFTA
jgi:hypothetical protein